MVKIELPYGQRHLTLEIPEERLEAVLEAGSPVLTKGESEQARVEKALAHPIGSPTLRELSQNKNKIVIISSDHTRPVPSKITMPLLLREIRSGNPEAEVTILVATGFHRGTTLSELRERYGEEIVNTVNIVVHDSSYEAGLTKIAKLPSGGDLILNKLAVEADLLVAEGFIEPHFFAGFSGGRKSVLPGIASRATIMANHCSAFIAHPNCRTGVLEGNPIQKDMLFAAQAAKLAFILNVVLGSDKKVIKAFAGHYDEAHLQGCRFVRELAGVQARPADIVITTNGGYPLDQNIYQTVKGMTAAEATCKGNGIIIAVSQCSDGHGGEDFFYTFAEAAPIEGIMQEILQRPSEMTIADQWESQILARILLKHPVIMVTDAPRSMVETMRMHWAPSLAEAVKLAERMLGNDEAKVTVIPDGVAVIVS